MALCCKVIDLIQPNFSQQARKVTAVGQVTIVQKQVWMFSMRTLIQVTDPFGIEQ